MRIQESTRYELYMEVEEFELFYEITSNVGYTYKYITNNQEGACYIVTLFDYTMDECYDLLKEKMNWELYEECNRMASDRIKYLVDQIYYQVYR